jgi:hypothetical protein
LLGATLGSPPLDVIGQVSRCAVTPVDLLHDNPPDRLEGTAGRA